MSLIRAEKFKAAFSQLDLDHDGKLTFDEFSVGLNQLGLRLPEREVRAIWGSEAKGESWRAMEDQVASKCKDLQAYAGEGERTQSAKHMSPSKQVLL